MADHPDLVFLDIQMPELDGFGVVSALRRDRVPAIIFVTAYDEYAIRAFEVDALDYLLKPVSPERFENALERATVRLARDSRPTSRRQLYDFVERMRAERGFLRRFVVRTGAKLSLFVSPTSIGSTWRPTMFGSIARARYISCATP